MRAAWLAVLTAIIFILLGYHPQAEDAGIYLSGVHLALNPALYPVSRAFVQAYMHTTIFPYLLAAVVRLLHVPLSWVLLSAHVFTLALLVFAIRQLSLRCFANRGVQWIATVATSLCLSVPVAGTALCIADPYLTPRSFSTPFTLLLLCAVLDRKPLPIALSLGCIFFFHPLMAIYASIIALVLWMLLDLHYVEAIAYCCATISLTAIIALSQVGGAESPAATQALLTRTYFFLGEWHWYEWIGLAFPLLLFLWMHNDDCDRIAPYRRCRAALSATAMACGVTVIILCLLFVHPASHAHLLARLQMLRVFHTLYILLFLLLSGTLAERHVRKGRRLAAYLVLPVLCCLAAAMYLAGRATFPGSEQLEMPWRAPTNPWLQAFFWSRNNTSPDALFALDSNYITRDGEDGQNFRATAERSSLPDYSKDGGSSAIFPLLAPAWQHGEQLGEDLSELPDSVRIGRLAPAGVSWIILQRRYQTGDAITQMQCPYANAVLLVCRLR